MQREGGGGGYGKRARRADADDGGRLRGDRADDDLAGPVALQREEMHGAGGACSGRAGDFHAISGTRLVRNPSRMLSPVASTLGRSAS